MGDDPATADRPASTARLTHGELVAAASALALLVLMFAVAWFGVDGIPGASTTSSAAAAPRTPGTGWR